VEDHIMTTSASPSVILDRLDKLSERLQGKPLVMPNEGCQGVDYHLAGMFLKAHMDYLRRLVEADAKDHPSGTHT
jgi:hypothetical protein